MFSKQVCGCLWPLIELFVSERDARKKMATVEKPCSQVGIFEVGQRTLSIKARTLHFLEKWLRSREPANSPASLTHFPRKNNPANYYVSVLSPPPFSATLRLDTIILHGTAVVLGRRSDDDLRNSSQRASRSAMFDGMRYSKACREPHALQEHVSLVLSTLS